MRPIQSPIACFVLLVMIAGSCSTAVRGSGEAGPGSEPASSAPSPQAGRTGALGSGAPTQPSGFERSTSAGVYTAGQARRGEATYANLCTGCHSATSHTGSMFWENWGGRPLSELFVYLTESMPKSDPGTLTPVEYGSIVAFILRLNGMPAGTDELPADTTALRRIRVDSTKLRTDTTERG